MADAFGKALMGYLSGDTSPYAVRRDDNHIQKGSLEVYFNDYPQWEDVEKEILTYVQGRVLDIGAGAGRHALYLQRQGFEVYAIDNSPLAVKVMKQREISNVYLMDLRHLDFPDNYFDSILMMFNGLGLAGTIEMTNKVLRVLYKISTPKAKIIATTIDPYKTNKAAHLAYQERNRKVGKLAGQIIMKIEYKGEVGDWLSLLMLSPKELSDIIKDTGWSILKISKTDKRGHYGIVLKKEGREMKKKVIFRPKSSWQKDNCINRSADYICPNESTLEAVCGKGNTVARIRCCDDERCKARAAELARLFFNSI